MAIVNIKRQYYQGKLIAYMKKNESVLRYRLCRIEEKYLTSNYRIKPNNPLGNYNELNKGIDELERKIDITISKLLAENPKLYLEAQNNQKQPEIAICKPLIINTF